jgi:hypothetical protein
MDMLLHHFTALDRQYWAPAGRVPLYDGWMCTRWP